jgi:hypothetical protein
MYEVHESGERGKRRHPGNGSISMKIHPLSMGVAASLHGGGDGAS